MNNDQRYFNQTIAEMIESIISCNTYQSLQFVNPLKFNELMLDLIENIATTYQIKSMHVNAIPLHRILFFSTFYLTIYGDEYRVTFINSKKIKVIRL